MAAPVKATAALLVLAGTAASLRSSVRDHSFVGSEWWPSSGLWLFGGSGKKIIETSKRPFRQELINDGDAHYSGEVIIGGQSVQAVVDTGSFELVVFSKHCGTCGASAKLYDDVKSTTFTKGSFTARQLYGSGTTDSQESWEKVGVGPMFVNRQVFWEVYDAKMPLLDNATFQMIMGVGPAAGAVKMAERDSRTVRKYAAARKRKGESPEDWDNVVAHYDEVLAHTKHATQFVQATNMTTMSICLFKAAGSNGVFVWNDRHPATRLQRFMKVPVKGDTYWSAYMSDVRLVKGELGPVRKLGCASGCQAVVDTGTSLIAAPKSVVDSIYDALGTWAENGFDCQNISSLPSLQFKLGGELFTLPPQSYVAQVDGEFPDYLKDVLPHGAKLRSSSQFSKEICAPIIMSLDEPSPMGPTWILGLPLFRQYYTSFVFDKKFGGDAMYFAKADDNCEPSGGSTHRVGADQSASIMRINARKLRVPQWVLESKARMRGEHPTWHRLKQQHEVLVSQRSKHGRKA